MLFLQECNLKDKIKTKREQRLPFSQEKQHTVWVLFQNMEQYIFLIPII